MIDYVKWDRNFETGIPLLDEQHKELILLINNLYKKKKDLSKEKISKLLVNLSDYVRVHFKSEEFLLYVMKYPQISLHKKEHQIFVFKIKEIIAQYHRGNLAHIPEDVFAYLKRWILDHILKTDMKYSCYKNHEKIGAIQKRIYARCQTLSFNPDGE